MNKSFWTHCLAEVVQFTRTIQLFSFASIDEPQVLGWEDRFTKAYFALCCFSTWSCGQLCDAFSRYCFSYSQDSNSWLHRCPETWHSQFDFVCRFEATLIGHKTMNVTIIKYIPGQHIMFLFKLAGVFSNLVEQITCIVLYDSMPHVCGFVIGAYHAARYAMGLAPQHLCFSQFLKTFLQKLLPRGCSFSNRVAHCSVVGWPWKIIVGTFSPNRQSRQCLRLAQINLRKAQLGVRNWAYPEYSANTCKAAKHTEMASPL